MSEWIAKTKCEGTVIQVRHSRLSDACPRLTVPAEAQGMLSANFVPVPPAQRAGALWPHSATLQPVSDNRTSVHVCRFQPLHIAGCQAHRNWPVGKPVLSAEGYSTDTSHSVS